MRTCLACSHEQRLAADFVGRLERLQIGIERRLRVDDHVLAAGQPDDDIGPHAAIVAVGDGVLLLEVAVLDHPGQLDDALELELAPAAANARALERVHELAGLVAQVLAGRVERRNPLHQLRAGLDAAPLGFLDFAIDLAERLRHRREQVLDGLLAIVDVGRGRRAGIAQTRFGQIEKRLVVALERRVAQRTEGVAQQGLRVLIGLQAFGVDRALPFDVGGEPRLRRTRGQPADKRANEEDDKTTDERGDQQSGFDGHQYRTAVSSRQSAVCPLPFALCPLPFALA